MNKFEQVSNDDHQMSVAGGRFSRSMVGGVVGYQHPVSGCGVGYPGPMSRRGRE